MDDQDLREVWRAEVAQEAKESNPLNGYCERVYFLSTSSGWRNGKQRRRKEREIELLKFLPSGRCVVLKDLHTKDLDTLAEEVLAAHTPPRYQSGAAIFRLLSQDVARRKPTGEKR